MRRADKALISVSPKLIAKRSKFQANLDKYKADIQISSKQCQTKPMEASKQFKEKGWLAIYI